MAGQSTIRLDDVTSKIGSRDILTKVDLEAQDLIKAAIMGAYPTHAFLGEEDLPPGRDAARQAIEALAGAEHLWIVDPVDGTTNFAHGQSLCGVILAYASHGQVLFGCIYDPFLDELFTAWAGRGAYLNGRRIRCCETPLLQAAVVCTGSPPNLASLQACLRATNAISADVRTMRMLGSASIMLSWLACGRVTVRLAAPTPLYRIRHIPSLTHTHLPLGLSFSRIPTRTLIPLLTAAFSSSLRAPTHTCLQPFGRTSLSS